MKDWDVWVVHEYFSLYFCFFADNKQEAFDLIEQRIEEEGLPKWLWRDAQEIKIEEMGSL